MNDIVIKPSTIGQFSNGKGVCSHTKVNQVDRTVFEKHYDECAEKWKWRSKYKWKMELGEWQKIVPEKKKGDDGLYF